MLGLLSHDGTVFVRVYMVRCGVHVNREGSVCMCVYIHASTCGMGCHWMGGEYSG